VLDVLLIFPKIHYLSKQIMPLRSQHSKSHPVDTGQIETAPSPDIDGFNNPNTEGSKIERLSQPRRISVTLLGDSAGALDYIAESQNITPNDAVRKAILLEEFFLKEQALGGKVLIEKANGTIREVVFR
jgi:hypothetical protein